MTELEQMQYRATLLTRCLKAASQAVLEATHYFSIIEKELDITNLQIESLDKESKNV